ncbi:murein tripeptide amidase MpaA [candidate division KSB1 bacterium]|nr:murein tripeptide amidase MpaA [candidate division KSB1 bacterium]
MSHSDQFFYHRSERGIIRHRSQVYGRSILGAPLELFLPPDPADFDTLVIAGHHGSEAEGTVLLSSMLRTLKPAHLRCGVITAINPDGLFRGTRCNAAGVDLNRNFPSSDWSPNPVMYRFNTEEPQNTRLSPGIHAASEPETVALLELIDRLRPKRILSLHAPLACIDDPRLSDYGRRLADETNLPLVGDVGYDTPGSFGTWANENDIHLITVELPVASQQEIRNLYSQVFLKVMQEKFQD